MTGDDLTPEQKRCKQTVVENRGWWTELFDGILELDPEWIALYSHYSSHPGDVLDSKLKEFIHVAVDALTTKMFNTGTRFHMEKAFDEGATVDELVEVIELTVNAGIYSTLVEGAGILAAEAGYPDLEEGEFEQCREEFEEAFGYWSEFWEDLARMDPEQFGNMTDLFSHPYKNGVLEPRERELINVATAITSTHLYAPGTRLHVTRALEAGATRAEILATIQISSVVGQHTTDEAIPILLDIAEERGLLDEG